MQVLFQPTRASPPLRSNRATKAPPAPPSIDLSVISSSTVVVPELRNLADDEIEFIEAVVRRAGPSATTFPIVFKAYNDILKERGMDSGEVRYYGKLLKLGTMKGKNWGEKWQAVKRQHNEPPHHSDDDWEPASSRVKQRSKSIPPQVQPVLPRLQDIDADTVPSDADEDDEPVDIPQYHQNSNLFSSRRQHTTFKSSPTQNPQYGASIVSSLRGLPVSMRGRPPASDGSVSEAETVAPSKASYSHDSGLKKPRVSRGVHSNRPVSTRVEETPQPLISNNRFAGARRAVIQSRGGDEDDTWNRIRMQQLDAEADRFREERLLERCWEVWSQAYQWIVTSQEQIDEARNAFVLRLALHHWSNLLTHRRVKYEDAAVLDDERRLFATLTFWRKRLLEKQQARWRNDMRSRMKAIKDRQNLRIFRDAWVSWRQKSQLVFADRLHNRRVLLLAFLKWKGIFSRVDAIQGKEEQLVALRDQRLLLQYWQTWRATTGIAGAEKEMVDRVHARVIWDAWSIWRKHTYDYHRATFFQNRNVQKRTLVRWQNALQKVHALETRADKHAARQDKILACAVLKVWLAHVRGREVDRQRDKKMLYRTYTTWKDQVLQNRKREDLAAVFYHKTDNRVLSTSLSHWQTTYHSHQNAYNAAERVHNDRLCKKFSAVWLSRFREGIEERKRQKLVKKLQNRQAARILYHWLLLTRQRRRCAQTEALIQERVQERIGRNALAYWTEQVIFMRERELNAIEIYNAKLERDAWNRLKSVHTRNRENLKLLDDHLILKQEDTLSRFFHRWLAATRVTQHRRYVLQSKEDEIKLMILQKAWDQWKSNYLERRLRPLEIEMLMRGQQNLMYQAFSVWHAKARTRPAIVAVKFNAEHTKRKFYLKWREVLPIAQKARRVREKHDRLILSTTFKQWLEAYRAKLVLKAVARARYLRLPIAGTRATIGPASLTNPPSLSASPPHESTPIPSKSYPIRPGSSSVSRLSTTQVPSVGEPATDRKEVTDDNEPAPTGERPRTSRLSRSPFGLGQGTGIVSLLRTNVYQDRQGQSDLSPPRPRFQFSNPKSRRGSSASGSNSRDVRGPSPFASANVESTPAIRGPRSTTSDDVGGPRRGWNQLRAGRRFREPSPSVTSQLTESPPASP
ncbi:hypothetical protein P691DRAFT_801539 [Macrolepiota fuliginosa MF-IS2]|uniref:Sfi1 spindle body domain-containing protein n=1 Tax=Macrolepiota fuliginosa MF-IS2 TaxID=1400762 RepID=A0A9P5XLS7_9AGAR|nr:hypothetical protein P691DRAFT_801539 [Macrolepiota fuliginosa MF-IS2]